MESGASKTVKQQNITKSDKIIVSPNSSEQLGSIALKTVPQLSLVAILWTRETRETLKRAPEKSLLKSGFKVVPLYLDNPAELPENVRLIVAVGAEKEMRLAKRLAAALRVPFILLLTGGGYIEAFAPTQISSKSTASKIAIKSAKTTGYVCPACVMADTSAFPDDDSFVPSLYGGLVSKLVSLFDIYALHFLCGNAYHEKAAAYLENLIAGAVGSMPNIPVKSRRRSERLVETLLNFSCVAASFFPELFNGSECIGSLAMEKLFARESRPLLREGENRMYIAGKLFGFFDEILSSPIKGFIPPPDNDARLESAAEYFGVTAFEALSTLRPVADSSTTDVFTYKLNEYRLELKTKLLKYELLYKKAYGGFKRLYRDGGYKLMRAFDGSDAALSIGMAPDLYGGECLLSLLKDAGFLEALVSGGFSFI